MGVLLGKYSGYHSSLSHQMTHFLVIIPLVLLAASFQAVDPIPGEAELAGIALLLMKSKQYLDMFIRPRCPFTTL